MQLVLLSGGSGKRLWPLSNNTRSKQFLSLLETEQGKMESMVQRVVRQIQESGLLNHSDNSTASTITLATNIGQSDIIVNQLGDTVSIVKEPERRDTFPAIALAAGYLKFTKKCCDDEVVVVMPCDPFTETGYFQTIAKMVQCIENKAADLVLMGITPTYPSTKYGYIVPAKTSNTYSNEQCIPVGSFTEKPSVEKAEELLKQSALWNGGVFAFRLGYIIEIVRKYIQSNSFEDIHSRYQELPKISFDYEIVEKAQSICAVPFKGKWKDLGTWNSFTEELRCHKIGNVVMGEHCKNTHVINELQIPIYADGLENIVIAISPDGILVCGKEQSENLKKEVENLTSRPMYEERRWGTYRVLDYSAHEGGIHSLTKSITINPGKNISYQIHHHRSEVWTLVEGEGIFVLDGKERRVKAGDTVIIPVRHYHAIKAISKLTFIEVQSGNPLIEEDIERKEWAWTV